MTVTWHVDELKASHQDPKQITRFIAQVKCIYGDVTIHWGMVHDYLGMILDYSRPRKLHVRMEKYLDAIEKDFLEEITVGPPSPAAKNLFNIREEVEGSSTPFQKYR